MEDFARRFDKKILKGLRVLGAVTALTAPSANVADAQSSTVDAFGNVIQESYGPDSPNIYNKKEGEDLVHQKSHGANSPNIQGAKGVVIIDGKVIKPKE